MGWRYIALVLGIFLGIASSAFAERSLFIKAVNKQKWQEAYLQAQGKNLQDLNKLVTWLRLLNDKNSNFYDLSNFIIENPSWPRISLLQQKIEESDFKNAKSSDIYNWFNKNPPKTIIGKKKYITLLPNGTKKDKYIKEVWIEGNFNKREQTEFLKKFKDKINENDHIKRIEYLIFNNKLDQASDMILLLPLNSRIIYETSINVQKGKGVKLHPKYLKHMVVLYSLAYHYDKNNDEEKLIKTLSLASEIENKNQVYFWKFKHKLIRTLIQNKKYYIAYNFAATHGTSEKKDCSEAEWLAGWIALQYLNKIDFAIKHFTTMLNEVKRPISIAKANYWLARSYEKQKNLKKAEHWYKLASQNFNTFYGQLAVCKINNCQVKIEDDPEVTSEDKNHFKNNSFVFIALILHESNYNQYVQEFIYKAIDNSNTIGEIALITRLGFELSHDHLSVEAAKHASYQDIHIIHSNYPILTNIYDEHSLDQAFVMSLIRQESVFNHRAVSKAGALGLMQLMPHVAKETAQKLNLGYKKEKLTSDSYFNTRLGIHHLKKLLDAYNNSLVLSIAAYNAGDKPTYEWIEKNGDPRQTKNIEKIIDWIELITYHETRSYVQRVLEGKSVYHLLINNVDKLPILSDLTK